MQLFSRKLTVIDEFQDACEHIKVVRSFLNRFSSFIQRELAGDRLQFSDGMKLLKRLRKLRTTLMCSQAS